MSSKVGKGSATPSKPQVNPTEESGVKGLNTWIDTEIKQMQNKLREKGKSPYLKLPEGESVITFSLEKPEKRVNNFGNEVADFKVVYNGESYILSVNTNSTLYRKILSQLAQGHTTLTIIRAGTGKETRYSIKA